MANIELVIKIDEEQYKFIKQNMTFDTVKNYPALLYDICEHIANGIPHIQPKMGHWIEGKYRDDDIRYNDSSYKCDKCGRIVDFKENYCPKCGANNMLLTDSEKEKE